MAFVPGKKHDLFMSYAHEESACVDVFRAALSKEFQWRTGKTFTVWQDSQNLRLGQNWTAEIEEGIRQAAAFMAVVSPCYHTSPWCRDERRLLLEHYGGLAALKVAPNVLSLYRFLKIIKAPGPDDAHELLLKELQDVRFFRPGDDYELPSDSDDFTATIRATVRAIRELFNLMRNQQQALYVAPGLPEMEEERQELQNQLTDYGFNVKPDILLSADYGMDLVRKQMEKSTVAIFLLGSIYDKFLEDQIEVAQECGNQMMFWIHPGKSKDAKDKQNDLISRVREHEGFPVGSQVLGGASIRSMIDDHLLSVLNSSQEEPAVTESAQTANVYLLFDSTIAGESQGANRLTRLLEERKLQVLRSGPNGEHEQLMRTSNAVLLFRSVTPDPDWWLSLNVDHLAYSQPIFQKEPDFKAKAALVSKPQLIKSKSQLKDAGIQVFGYDEPFSPNILDPFFDKLRQAGGAYAGR